MNPEGKRLCIRAPAKINLFLHVTGRRDDGYHLLDSIFLYTGLHDRLTVAPASDLALDVGGAFADGLAAEPPSRNLILRAAQALRDATGTREGAHMRLEKAIPLAAGLGGGSADAAAALRLLARLWGVPSDKGGREELLSRLALALGADIPPCIDSRPARIGGIGERVVPLDEPMPAWGLLLVNPGIPMPTPSVFAALRKADPPFTEPLPARIPWQDTAWLAARTRNDLEPFAIRLAPALGRLLDRIGALEGCLLARMSGSGATCFALFETVAAAERAARTCRAEMPHCWSWAGGFHVPDEVPSLLRLEMD
ncbi:MAG: 4-(cytidine 5'-diphospho)-2-C-methyl-D-erythritol kinase [Rhodothalassiaceae bacterium]